MVHQTCLWRAISQVILVLESAAAKLSYFGCFEDSVIHYKLNAQHCACWRRASREGWRVVGSGCLQSENMRHCSLLRCKVGPLPLVGALSLWRGIAPTCEPLNARFYHLPHSWVTEVNPRGILSNPLIFQVRPQESNVSFWALWLVSRCIVWKVTLCVFGKYFG